MNPPPRIAALGEVMQLAFVPIDVDRALHFWTKTIGAGPFFALEHVQFNELKYRGSPSPAIDFSMLLGYWGNIQIELIRQHNDAPSVYRDWHASGHEGLHHVGILADDMQVARESCALAGATIVQEARLPGGGEAIYVDTGGGPGTMVEFLMAAPRTLPVFEMMREAARTWDGTNPVRHLG